MKKLLSLHRLSLILSAMALVPSCETSDHDDDDDDHGHRHVVVPASTTTTTTERTVIADPYGPTVRTETTRVY